MNPWILLIAQHGIPLAYKIWAEWRDKTEPTQEDWNGLLALVNKTDEQYTAEELARRGQ